MTDVGKEDRFWIFGVNGGSSTGGEGGSIDYNA